MKKSFLLLSTSLLLAGSIGGGKIIATSANEPTVGEEIQALLADYLNADGYTKKTTIGLNAAAVEEMSACFHCNETAKKRTTYYRPGQLLLAAEDGSIPAGSGSYVYDAADHEVKRAAALGNSTDENMWTNLSEPVSVGQINANGLEDYYITLVTFMSNGYFDGWGKNGDVYYYDLTNEDKVKDNETHIYNCDIWNEFLYFCAPMLYKNSGYYLSAKSLTITKKYDADSNGYLCLDMYLENIDSGKLDCDYLAEARIYNGNRVFIEDLSTGYFLAASDNVERKFEIDPNDASHVMLKNVSLTKGTKIKIQESNPAIYHGVSQGAGHNLSVAITQTAGMVDDQDNYIIPENGTYDFYVNFDNGSYRDMWINDQNAKTIYVQDTWDKGGVGLHYWWNDGKNDVGSVWEYTPAGTFTGKYDSGHGMFRFVIPGAAEKIIIKYDGKQSSTIVLDSTNNSYWISDAGGGTPSGNAYNWSEQ